LVGLDFFTHQRITPAGASAIKFNDFKYPSAIAAIFRAA
jgi:hypothetical protein